jgi:hypothetical protein
VNVDVTVETFVNSGLSQIIRLVYDPGKLLAWDVPGEGIQLPTNVVQSAQGRIDVWIDHRFEDQNLRNDIRIGRPLYTATAPPAVRSTLPVAQQAADISTVVESEDGGGTDWNDTVVRLTWPGRIISVLSWANDPTAPVSSSWTEVAVFAGAHVYYEEARGGTPYVHFLGSGTGVDLRPGAPVEVPSDQTIAIETKGVSTVVCRVSILDRV